MREPTFRPMAHQYLCQFAAWRTFARTSGYTAPITVSSPQNLTIDRATQGRMTGLDQRLIGPRQTYDAQPQQMVDTKRENKRGPLPRDPAPRGRLATARPHSADTPAIVSVPAVAPYRWCVPVVRKREASGHLTIAAITRGCSCPVPRVRSRARLTCAAVMLFRTVN